MPEIQLRLSRVERAVRAAEASAASAERMHAMHKFQRKIKYVRHDVVGRTSLAKVLGLE